jgi:hypothetical protein
MLFKYLDNFLQISNKIHFGLKQFQILCKRSNSTGHVHIKIATLSLFIIAWIHNSVKILNYIRAYFYLILNVLVTTLYYAFHHTKFCWELMNWIVLSENDGNFKHRNEQLSIDFVIKIRVYTLYTTLQHVTIFLMEINLLYSQKTGNSFTSWGTIIFLRKNFLRCFNSTSKFRLYSSYLKL